MREGDVTLNESVHFILLAMVLRPHAHHVVYKFEMDKMGSVSATQKQQLDSTAQGKRIAMIRRTGVMILMNRDNTTIEIYL